MPNWRVWNAGSALSSSMIALGSVPFCSSRKTSIWFWCVLSTQAWHAATPLPGTTTAWTPIRNWSSRSTQVADAITTRPVLRSTAITDQVADAVAGSASSENRTRTARRMDAPSLQFADRVADAQHAGTYHPGVDAAQVQIAVLVRVDEP